MSEYEIGFFKGIYNKNYYQANYNLEKIILETKDKDCEVFLGKMLSLIISEIKKEKKKKENGGV